MESPDTKKAPNLEDSGCVVDGLRSALCDGDVEDENSMMLDHLEMSGINESKSSLKDDSPVQEKRGFHVLIAIWEESPERNKLHELWEKHGMSIVLVCLTVTLLTYSIVAIAISGFDKAKWLFAITMFLWFCMTYMFIRNHCGGEIYRVVLQPIINGVNSKWKYLKWVVLVLVLVALGVFFGLDTAKQPERFISLAGLFANILFCWIFSKHRRKVKWRPVIWGLGLQFVFGLLILRTSIGFQAFKGLGDQVSAFLEYTSAGASFVFGENYTEHFFAFKVLPIIIFFSSVISLCYYVGIMQLIIKKIAWLMQITMKTSGVESLNAAGNIFIGQTEAPLMVRPFLEHVTMSELHAIMTGGFATIAGSVLAAYIEFGIRSEIITTYALCGFANFSSIGIQIGGMAPLAPSRRQDMATVAFRALVAGTIACFMTACIAGVLYDEALYDTVIDLGTSGNSTG
ncbi:solute carrier family 28 member 3-like isoform X2 [Orbicella faveolata]|uniref:solute carrier family 28 member 3-like isoform X2 n=1 Tax=Orbicella faveolata TaxID=48498 RepID=UPI0009E616DD|nr:solute carrier family 28 member 3-like isoform X2 [Orbicella faveolata]